MLKQAFRALLKAPGFAVIASLTLALGIGANTAIFSVVDAVLLQPLPYPQSDRLMLLRESDRQFPMMSVCFADYQDWVAENHSFSYLASFRGTGAVLTQQGLPVILDGQDATWQYFPALGIKPELGRTFTQADDRVGAPDVVVIADSLWRERLNHDPNILGRTLDLNARPYTVIGVMPAGFPGLTDAKDAPQYWVPLGAQAIKGSGLTAADRGSHPGLSGLGRLEPGVTLAAARADMDRIARNLAQHYPKSNTGEGVPVQPYLDYIVRNDGPTALWVLLAAVGMVLLIACANVANLLLARAAARQKANAIRTALGASRARLMREHLLESLLLALVGSAVGLALAWLAIREAPVLLQPLGMTRTGGIAINLPVLGFTVALALATSVLFGLAPAWHASQTEIAGVLKEGGRDTAAGGSGGRLRAILVVLEMTLALVLLAGAGLLIRSLLQLQQVNPGFEPEGTVSFQIDLPAAKYPQPDQQLVFMRALREKLAHIPGVSAVGGLFPLPFSGNDWENTFTIPGRAAPPPGQSPSANYAMVLGDAFPALGIHLLRGRVFNDHDTASSTPVIMIDEVFAERYWPGSDAVDAALGQQVHTGGKDRIVVGVFARVLDYGLDAATEMDKLPEMYVPITQSGNAGDTTFVLRTSMGDPLALRSAIAAAIQSLDPDQPLFRLQTMNQKIDASLASRQLTQWLMGAFALLALTLAGIGIYGLLSYAVAQRQHEIGIRMALGANARTVQRMMMRQGMTLAAVGAILGLAAALVLGRLANSFLYGVSWADPITLIAVPTVLLGIAALACYLPARRATRVDPVIALHGE
jgi:putative ABC transport system permease protein